jgi:ATP-dependent exoDNAse (exonuclease V) beta subunit
MTGALDDQAARDAITETLDETLFVEASAGSGKTTQLVARLVNLLATEGAAIDEVAAITFTEAAAAELRDRLGEELERRAADDADCPAARAAAGLESAAVTTLHGFARRILAEHPLEAGLPPVFEVLDGFQSLVDFDERWAELVDRLLADPDDARAFQVAVACRVGMDALRQIAQKFEDNWDLLPEAPGPPPPPPEVDTAAVLTPLREALALSDRCTDSGDRLLGHLAGLVPWADRLAGCTDEVEALGVMARFKAKLSSASGRKENWGGHKESVTDHLRAAQAALEANMAGAGCAALVRLGAAIAALTRRAAGERRAEGRLRFHDLLVLARDLVRDDPTVHRALHERYRFLLIDEFQDTDPIQAELAVRIASPETGPDWRSLPVGPGRLFFVGDPKQSIYRFRRADTALFEELKSLLVDEATELTTNFRSVPGILHWVDDVVGAMIGPSYPGSGEHRPACGEEPPVVVLGAGREPAPDAETALLAEADDVAAAVLAARDGGWPVGPECRPATLRDITVLVPTRRLVPYLEEVFDRTGIDYRLESSSLVYNAPEVRSLLAVLHAVDDPTDQVSLIAALRSPAFGCGDDDLVRHKLGGGRWDYRRPGGPAEGPVATGMAALRALHDDRWWLEVSELVGRVVDERRLLPIALDGPQWRDAWRRLRFVLDQARRFTESSMGDLRRFLVWVDLQAQENARVTEVVLPESDVDAVSVMTVHAAKGLEFPVVVVAGLGTKRPNAGVDVLFGPDGPELSVRRDLRSPGYEQLLAEEGARARLGAVAVADEEEATPDDAERIRLLYVATTRACDHLVVSVHRGERATGSLAARLGAVCLDHPHRWRELDRPAARRAGRRGGEGGPAPEVGDAASRGNWLAGWTQRVGPGAAPRTVSATGVAHLVPPAQAVAGEVGDEKEEEPDRPAWRRGRAGTAVGRAVHGVLQVVDLATGDGLGDLAAAQAAAEQVPGRAAEVERLARGALGSDVVRRAVASGRYWRELYVGTPVGGRVLEGVVDLLFEGAGGLEVVDYKTDRVDSDEEIDRALARHRLQGAAYALAVEAATGRPVTRCTFLFLRADGAVARPVGDLDDAKDEVRALVTEG